MLGPVGSQPSARRVFALDALSRPESGRAR